MTLLPLHSRQHVLASWLQALVVFWRNSVDNTISTHSTALSCHFNSLEIGPSLSCVRQQIVDSIYRGLDVRQTLQLTIFAINVTAGTSPLPVLKDRIAF